MSAAGDPKQESPVNLFVRRSIDRAASRALRLPPAANRYRVIRGVRIPMRDGAELLADHFVPVTSSTRGTILIRAPYGRGYPLPQFFAQPYAARGFHVVVQSVRGTYGSAGVFVPAAHETDDGLDTVRWLRDQPWFTGRLATIGASYLGLTQWALLQDPPPELKTAVILSGPHDYSAAWATGAFTLDDCLGWCEGIANQNEIGPLARRLRGLLTRDRVADEKTPKLPLIAAGRAVLGEGAPSYESWLEHPDRSDPYWDTQRFTDALHKSQVPVLLINGWQDVFLEQTLEQYRRLRERDVEVAMTIGPWTHARLLRKGASTFAPEAFSWLTAHLGGEAETPPRRPVRVHVNGHGWLELPDWPPDMPSVQPPPAAGRHAGRQRARHGSAVDRHLRPRRPDTDSRWPPAVRRGGLPR